MTIRVTGPDGRVHTFPDGTAAAEIDRTMHQRYSPSPSLRQAQASAVRAAGERRGRRSAWERLVDVAQDTFATSAPGQLNRRADPNANGFDAGDLWQAPQLREGGLIDRGLDAVAGQDRGFLRGTDTTTEADRQEQTRRAGFSERSRTDSFLQQKTLGGKVLHGGAALTGTLLATAADPTSWVSAGRTVLTRAAIQMGVAGAVDAAVQTSDIASGVVDRYDVSHTALSVAAGGAFSVVGDGAGAAMRFLRQPEAGVAAELEVGDDLFSPPLSAREVGPTPDTLQKPREGALETQVGVPATDEPGAPQGRSADSPESTTPAALETSADARRATEGITVETPDGRVVDVPAEPASRPAGWEGVDWGARGSPERAKAAKAHIDGLKRWIKPEEVNAFVRALDDGLPDSTTGSRINERWVDWGALDDPNEALKFTSAISDIFRTTYSKAGDARQGWDKTAEIARQMGVSLSDVIKTHADIKGEGGIAARAGALRDAALASDKAFYDQLTTTRAAMVKGDMTGVPAMVEALNRTVVLGAMDAGASAEIARALHYRQRKAEFAQSDLQGAMVELGRILNKGEELDANALNKVMDELTDAYEKGGSAGLRQRIATIREMGFWDYVGYAFTANLLSAPTTHIRNALGTPIHALFQIGERYVAAGIGSARVAAGLGSRERVTFREAHAYVGALFQSWAEPLALAGKAALRGAPISDTRSLVMASETTPQVPFAFSRERARGWLQNPADPKSWADFGGVVLFETMRTLGFRPSVATDELNKALGRRMQLNALTYREAAYRSALAAPEDADRVFSDTLAALQEEPTAAAFREARDYFAGRPSAAGEVFDAGSRAEEMALVMRSVDHRQMALDHARLLAFQDSGPIVEKLDAALKAVPLVKHLWVNFVRTPVALLKAGMVSRNPAVGGVVSALELTTRGGRTKHKALLDALTKEEQQLARGGAEADLVLARQVVGAAVLSTFWMLWAGGNVVGKQTPEERRSGVQDYSFKLPNGTWVQFTGMSPVGEMLGLVADVGKALRDHDAEDAEEAAILGALAAAVRNNVVNKSFLAGVSDFMEMVTGGAYGASSDEASGEAITRKLGEALAPRIVPGGSLLRRAAQDQDPVVRDARDIWQLLMAGIPTMSDALAARRDFLGRPMVRPEGQRGVFQAFNTSTPAEDPLERELADLAFRLPEGFRIGMSPRKMNGEDLTPEEYSRLVETQGQLYRDPATGRNMEEALRHLITTEDYLQSAPEARAFDVTRIISRYRERANAAVRNPRSPLFMREAARRTGAVRLVAETKRRGWHRGQAIRRSWDYGLDPEDPEVQQLHEALFPDEG